MNNIQLFDPAIPILVSELEDIFAQYSPHIHFISKKS